MISAGFEPATLSVQVTVKDYFKLAILSRVEGVLSRVEGEAEEV
jgi:hypothetical protein